MKLKENECLNCKALLDAATGANHKDSPRPDDITICIKCGHVMAFSDEMLFRELSEKEMIMVAGNAEIIALQQIVNKRGKMDEYPHYVLDENNKPKYATFREWSTWMEKMQLDRCIKDQVGEVEISTCFIGTCGIYWETKVFGGKLDREQIKSDLYEDALKTHDEMVRSVEYDAGI